MYRFNRCIDRPINFQSNTSFQYTDANMAGQPTVPNDNMTMYAQNMNISMEMPVYECPQERVCHKEFIHQVNHVCPINTRIINHHIYKHSYTPCYTACEENEICNVYDGCCNNF